MFSEARFVKAMLREYELCVNLLGSRGCSWPASAPAASWSWELEHENGSWILININLTLELETLT